jgi:hypothetical protein
MTKYNITVITTLSVEVRPAVTATVKSEAAMWNYLREVRNNITDEDLKVGIQAIVTTEDGKEFKNIVFKKNAKGKIEMPNSVKETCRYAKVKAAKIAAAAKAEAKKAKKREADRRYREKKKAAKAAALAVQAEETK